MGDSSDDDALTPPRGNAPRRRRSHWGDTERSAVGAGRRGPGVLAVQPTSDDFREDAEITSPVDLLERDLSQAEIDLVDRSRREPGDPATYGDVIKLASRLIRSETAEHDPASRDERIAQLERDMAPIRRLGRWAMGVAAGAAVAVGVFLYGRGFTEGSSAAKFEAIQKLVEELQHDVHQLERHSSIRPAISPDAISSATTKDIP